MEDFNLKSKVKIVKKREEPIVKRKILLNMIKSFFIGGLICAFAEGIFLLFNIKFDTETSNNYTIISLIFIASSLTGLGVYDRIGQFAGCGSIIPITGFSNSMTSSAMEAKTEGIVLGVLNNIFKLAGSVIAVAVICGVIMGLIKYLGGELFG